MNGYDYGLGPDLSGGHAGVDLSLLYHCVRLADKDGWALEFGVGKGTTLRMIAEVLPVIGFDSFDGLPEDWRPEFKRGAFATDPPTDIPGATIVQGLFADTVPNYEWPEKISLIHFDADLYSSTKTVLDSLIEDRFPWSFPQEGTIIVFDEFFGYPGAENHEQRAWAECAEDEGLEWDVIGHGREQWAVRIK